MTALGTLNDDNGLTMIDVPSRVRGEGSIGKVSVELGQYYRKGFLDTGSVFWGRQHCQRWVGPEHLPSWK